MQFQMEMEKLHPNIWAIFQTLVNKPIEENFIRGNISLLKCLTSLGFKCAFLTIYTELFDFI